MASHRQRFTVSAVCRGNMRSETRERPASAMVLADRWAQEGCQDITLTDPNGSVCSSEDFRASLLLVRQLAARARLS